MDEAAPGVGVTTDAAGGTMFSMREFRPPVRPSKLRIALAIVLPLIALVPLGGVAAVLLGTSPASYSIGDGALVVRSGDLFSGSRTIRLTDVTEARVVSLVSGRRVAGTALPGFCAGRFAYPDLGTVWQVTTCGRVGVLVQSQGEERPTVISPADPQTFVNAVRAGTPTEVTLPPPQKGPVLAIALAVVPIVAISVLMVTALMLFGPKRMRYWVGNGRLEVQTLFGRSSWPTAGARARPYVPSRLLRVAGTAAPGMTQVATGSRGKRRGFMLPTSSMRCCSRGRRGCW